VPGGFSPGRVLSHGGVAVLDGCFPLLSWQRGVWVAGSFPATATATAVFSSFFVCFGRLAREVVVVVFPFRGWWVVPASFRQGRGSVSLPVLVLGRSSVGLWLLGVPARAGACGLARVGSVVAVVSSAGRGSSSFVRWPVAGAGSVLLVAGAGVTAAGSSGSAAGPVAWSSVWPLVPVGVRRSWLSSVPGAVVG